MLFHGKHYAQKASTFTKQTQNIRRKCPETHLDINLSPGTLFNWFNVMNNFIRNFYFAALI